MYHKILVPLDGSKRAERILPHVEELAKRYKSKVIFLQVVEYKTVPTAGIYLFSPALLCFAALIKSAQFPFRSWLLAAMVAPASVSALLNSSTKVKVGVYQVLRRSPVMRETISLKGEPKKKIRKIKKLK